MRDGEDSIVGGISMLRILFRRLPLTSVIILFHCLAVAASTDITSMGLEDLMQIPVYGASRFEQKPSDAPSDITLITADEIQKYGYRTLSDLLRSVRGFYVTNDRSYTYIGIRGFGIPGDYNARLLIQIDGHRINDNIYDQGAIGSDFILDMDLIDKVEIIRGPGSSLYGSNAFFGVVNIITKKATSLGQPGMALSYGSYDSTKGRLSFGKQFDSGTRLAVSGSSLYSRGQNLYYSEFDSPATHHGIAEGCDSDQSGNLFGRLEYGHFSLESAWVSRDKTTPTASFETDFNNPNSHTVDERWYMDMNYRHRVLENMDVTARLYYDEYRYKGQYIYGGKANIDNALGKSWGTEFIVSRPFLDEMHRLTAGAEFVSNFTLHQDNEDTDPYRLYLDSNESNQKWAVFIQDEYRVTSWFLINAGLRQDQYSSFGDSLNPRLAFIFQPRNSTTLKLIYGTAFRAPNAYELYYYDGFYSEKPNQLNPEKIATYEVVLEQRLFKIFRWTVGGFSYRIDDLIQQMTDTDTGLSVFKNLDNVTAKGFQTEVEGVWDSGLRGNVSYTYQDVTNDQSSQEQANCPQHIAKLNLIVPLYLKNWFVGSGIQYLSPRKTLSKTDTEAVWLADMTMLARNIYPGLDMSFSGYNLFNQKYRDPVGLEFRQNGIEQDGAGFMVKLAYTF